MFHRSERLLLRPVWPEDWRAVLSGIGSEGIVRNLASAPWPYLEKDAREFAALPDAPRHPRFVITRARDAQLVGCIGIDPVPAGIAMEASDAELGYWIARPYWGQGFATEAARAVLTIARTLGHRRVSGSHFLDNPASGRVLQKLGFEPTGRVVRRWSCGRGKAAESVQYMLDLDGEAAHGPRRAA